MSYEKHIGITGILSFMRMFFTVGIAQEKKSLGDEVFKEYELAE